MVVFIAQTKAKFEQQLVYNCVECFLYFMAQLCFCGLRLTRLCYPLAYKE